MSSIFGQIFTLTTYGESHGAGVGGVIDGCPSQIFLDEQFIQAELDKRRPGSASAAMAGTARREADAVRFLSGVYQGKTTGTPIAFFIENTNQRSGDYSTIESLYRPGHADRGYECKYGIRDPRGGGRSSGRETAARVAGGAIAQLFLSSLGIHIHAAATALGGISAEQFGAADFASSENRLFAAANDAVIPVWQQKVEEIRSEGDTLGGLVQIQAHGVPAGLGEPVFHKLDAVLAMGIMSVGAVKGVEFGSGFRCSEMRGSESNDALFPKFPETPKSPESQCPGINDVCYGSNHAGGIVGGISTGQAIIINAAVKPIPSISRVQHTVNRAGEAVELKIGGRHDICAIPRIVPVLKAMTALVLADMILLQRRMR